MQHRHTRPIGGSDGSHTTLHVPGVAHWASIKQASVLVRGGDTHTPKEKKRKGGESSAAAGMTAESMPMSRLQAVT